MSGQDIPNNSSLQSVILLLLKSFKYLFPQISLHIVL